MDFKNYLILTFLFLTISLNGQVILSEDFESNSLPEGWTIESDATDGGWRFGSVGSISSQFFDIANNGSNGIAGTNDDQCNCNKRNEYLITKPFDLTGYTNVVLSVDIYFTDQGFQGVPEDASLEVSTDGVTWEKLEDLHGHGSWDTHKVDISAYAGSPVVYAGFRYDDGGGYLYGMGIDNVVIEVPKKLDADLVELEPRAFGVAGEAFPIKGTIYNQGSDIITSMDMSYTINGGNEVIQTFENINIAAFAYRSFEFMEEWIPVDPQVAEVAVNIISVNGQVDEDESNNLLVFSTEIFGDVVVPNNIEAIMNSTPVVTDVAQGTDGLDRPTDLDFFPVLGKDELWVINQRTENEGGSTMTISNVTSDDQKEYDVKIDGNSWHFMSLPTGIAFSEENYNFANSAGVQDANHGGGTFTGPALWSSDPTVYAQPSGGNGSHLDMLHGSPFSMGIAHEVDNAFWVYDDWNSDIVRYDFVDDHGPGADDHSDGRVRRYSNIGIQRDGDIPNHLILNKETGWLYFVDNGNNRIMRLDINSGEVGSSIPEINEPLAEHSRMSNFTTETVIVAGLNQPCGIEQFENYILVGNYGNGDIGVYDIDQEFLQVGTISTGASGLTGIKVGPDGNIYATNRVLNSVISVAAGEPTATKNIKLGESISISPNPTSESFSINIDEVNCGSKVDVEIYNVDGRVMYINENALTCEKININKLSAGMYVVKAIVDTKTYTSKIYITK